VPAGLLRPIVAECGEGDVVGVRGQGWVRWSGIRLGVVWRVGVGEGVGEAGVAAEGGQDLGRGFVAAEECTGASAPASRASIRVEALSRDSRSQFHRTFDVLWPVL
jgi:hypothetical protein